MTPQNLTPTDDQMRATLVRFTRFPAERSSDPVECHLFNAGFIARAKSNRRAPNYKHGRYARQVWTITDAGRAFLNPCRALLAPRDIRRDNTLAFYAAMCCRRPWQAVEDLAPLFERPVRVDDCPF